MDIAFNGSLVWPGAIIMAVSMLIIWRMSRYDLRGMVFESLWQVVRRRRTAENRTVIERELAEIAGQAGLKSKARRTAGKVFAHVVAPVLTTASLIGMLVGAALILAGFYFS